MAHKRGISPLTTWHSQNGLLLISFTWGLSYMTPPGRRIKFSEVFPEPLNAGFLPMWGWGVVLVTFAAVAAISERVISRSRRTHPTAWRVGWSSHMILAGAYATLAGAALIEGIGQLHGGVWSIIWGSVSAISRPVLWGYIMYLHSTYARLPRPFGVAAIADQVASDA